MTRHRPKHRKALAVLAAGILAPLLAACGNGGFKPLYAELDAGGAGAEQKLAQVDVAPIPGRVGQRIRNDLIFHSTGGGARVPPAYRLEVAIRESVSSTLVQITGQPQGSTYNLDASFRLIRLSDNSVMLQGTSYGRAAFERFDSVFANVRAQKDAEDRAARTVAAELKSRLSAFLAGSA